MTRRSILNLSAFAIIAAGGGMLLAARPAAAAPTGFCSFCDKALKRMISAQSACTEGGGTFSVDTYSCSCAEASSILVATCG